MTLRTLDSLGSLQGKTVFLRVDFNVPRDGDRILDGTRLRAAVPTLERLAAAGARTLIASHCGRPEGKVVPELSMKPIAAATADLLSRPVEFVGACIGEEPRSAAVELEPGGFLMLENLRFDAGETANDADFARALAAPAEVYVDDAFGCAHRAHASIVGVPPHCAARAAGLLLAAEVEALGELLARDTHPFVAILGGAKISSKIATLENLLRRADAVLVGGAMANTFLAAQGHDLGASRIAENEIDIATRLVAEAGERGTELLLPSDLVFTESLEGSAPRAAAIFEVGAGPAGLMAVDIGPATRRRYAACIAAARRVFWNGPLGVFEVEPFDAGTAAVAAAVAASPAYTVIGGGETVAAVEAAGCIEGIDHVSTGGGAALSFLAGLELPGIEILKV